MSFNREEFLSEEARTILQAEPGQEARVAGSLAIIEENRISKEEGRRMIKRKKGKLSEISRLVPCSVTLLSVATQKRQDAMTASAMFVSESVPLLVVSVAKHIVSHDLIEEAGEFALNVASTKQVKLAKQLGFTHGREVDKFKKFRVSKMRAKKVRAPLIKGSFAHIECRVITSLSAANYVIYLAEVVDYRVDPKLAPVTWYNNKYFAPTQQVF